MTTMLQRSVSLTAVLMLGLSACAQGPASTADVAAEAIEAMGGRDALQGVGLVVREGEGDRYHLGQMREPGGEQNTAQLLDVTEYVDLESSRAAFSYTVINDGFQQDRLEVLTTFEGEPIGWGTTSGRANIAVSPGGLFSWAAQNHPDMLLRRDPVRVLLAAAEAASGEQIPEERDFHGRASLHASMELFDGEQFDLYFDAESGLLNGFVVLDTETMLGDLEAHYIFDDYQTAAGQPGVLLPHSTTIEKGGRHYASMRYDAIRVNDSDAMQIFELPADVQAEARQVIAADGPWVALELEEIGPGLYHVLAFSHNSMVVEFDDFVAVVEAPYTEDQSLVLARLIEEQIGKPIRYVAPSHSHYDHTGGLRALVALGATALLSSGHDVDLRPVLEAQHSNPPDELARRRDAGEAVGGIEVFEGSHVIESGEQSLELHEVGGFPHMEPMVLPYVPQAGALFQSDLFFGAASEDAQRLYEAIVELELEVQSIVGGHGGVLPFSSLQEAVASE